MPDDTDESELGSAPTTVTSVVPEQRNRVPTQQIAVPEEAEPSRRKATPDARGNAEPPWAESELPSAAQTLDQTFPQAIPPTPTPRQRVRVLLRLAVHEFKKLPARTRTLIVVALSTLGGLVLGLLIAPSGGRAPARAIDDDLVKHAKRLSLPERDAVMRSLSVSDTAAALMMLRAMGTKDRVAAEPLALALRGRLALTTRDGLDALDSFETALTADPKLADEAWLPGAVVQTFAANKAGRTTALLGRLPKEPALRALEASCMDWQVRIRRGAQDALKNLGGACPDPVGALMIDAYQAEKCDAARSVAQKLLPLQPTDERVGAALDALSRRPGVANCVAELIPRK